MNSMSISPVKPPLNPGNLAVPPAATATNLSKSALPPNNSFTALNLVPENKAAAAVPTVATTSDKLVESPAMVSSATPTSNGSVSPLADTGQSAVVPTAVTSVQNCNEKNEVAENLSINNTAPKVESSVVEPPKPKADVEKKKEEKKSSTDAKGSSPDIKAASGKDATPQNVSIIDVPSSTEKCSVKKYECDEKKTETTGPPPGTVQAENVTSTPVAKESVEPAPTKVEPVPTKVEPVPTKVVQEEKKPAAASTVAKAENESAKTEVEPALKKKVESSPVVESAPAKTGSTPKTASPPKAIKRKAKGPVESIAEEESADGRKSKRTRLPTQPYQSPIPELQLIAKLNTPTKTTPKTSNDKIIAFYKNEFLAVRNPEGSFYICQTFQNIHRSSTKIKIRWFTNLPLNIYTPDFYDTTEFDCILTNVTMNRVEKDRWKLPDAEQSRIENILKRALDVEKGVAEQPSVTEEHPDGLDLSLYKDEAQLQKRKKKFAASPKKSTSPPEPMKAMKSKKVSKPPAKTTATTSSAAGVKKSARVSSYMNRDSTEVKSKVVEKGAKVDKSAKTVEKSAKKDKKKKKSKSLKKPAGSTAATKAADSVNSKTWEPSVKASNSSKVVLSLRKEESSPTKSTTTPETKGTKRTSSVSLRASAAAASAATPAPTNTSPAKRKKEEPKTSPNNSTTAAATEKTGKVRNAGSAVSAKINSAAIRTTKEKERKAATATSQRKK